jgi:decaprenylphospho-beta-D-erythro-pentofuranosid-2-ulose 2-reductase
MSDRNIETILILGGTSAIAAAYARLCANEGMRIILLGRDQSRLSANAADLVARGAKSAETRTCDLADTTEIEAAFAEIIASNGTPDEILLAYGVLGDMAEVKGRPRRLQDHLTTNFLSAALWLEQAASAFEAHGAGRLVVIGSVAGDRGRQSNYPYGAANAALERYVEGLAHRFALGPGKITAHLVKPGFVDTPMTDGMEKGGFMWAAPEKVARAMRRGVQSGRRVFYVPWFWRLIMAVIRAVPAAVLHRTRL